MLKPFESWNRNRERIYFFLPPGSESTCKKNELELKFIEASFVSSETGPLPRQSATSKTTKSYSISGKMVGTGYCIRAARDGVNRTGVANVQDYWVSRSEPSFDLLLEEVEKMNSKRTPYLPHYDLVRIGLKNEYAKRVARLTPPSTSLAELQCVFPNAVRFAKERDRVFFYYANEFNPESGEQLPPRLMLADASSAQPSYRAIFGTEQGGLCESVSLSAHYLANIQTLDPRSSGGIEVKGPRKFF